MKGHAMRHDEDARQYILGSHINCRHQMFATSGERIDPERQQTIEQLRRKMWKAAEREDYERAAELRDRLQKLTESKTEN